MLDDMLKIKPAHGQSIIEIIIALAVFSLIASAMTSLIIGSFSTHMRGGEIATAESLADEGVEAAAAIGGKNWNDLPLGDSVIDVSAGKWAIASGTGELIADKYVRTLSVQPVYRGAEGNIVPATSTDARLDPFTKFIKVRVEWTTDNSSVLSADRGLFIALWNYDDWVQSNWSGGSGQAAWSATDKYDTDDGNIDISVPASASLLVNASSTFPSSGQLESSDFDTGSTSDFTVVAINAEAPAECGASCLVKVQIKTAQTEADLAGANYTGPNGTTNDSDYYASSTGTVVAQANSGNRWVKYKAMLVGDGTHTPILKSISIGYKNRQ